jgi:hypothetical protein
LRLCVKYSPQSRRDFAVFFCHRLPLVPTG